MNTQGNPYTDADIDSLATKLSTFACGLSEGEQAAFLTALMRAQPAGDDTQGFGGIPIPIIKHGEQAPTAQFVADVQTVLQPPALTALLHGILAPPAPIR